MIQPRRKVLTALGTTGVAALAGCLMRSGNESPTEPSRGGNESPTETAHPLSEHTAKLTATDGDSGDDFGESVAISADGTTALVGAVGDEDPNGRYAGSAYVFERARDSWHQQAKLAPADGAERDEDLFGMSVAMTTDGTTALVGAPGADAPNGKETGTTYVFERTGGSWAQQAIFAPADGDTRDFFGWSVAMTTDGTTALVGARGAEAPYGEDVGSAYVFGRASGSWTQQANFAPASGDSEDNFGWSVAVAADGTTALVGTPGDAIVRAPGEKDPKGPEAWEAYVFKTSGGSWTQQAKLAAADGDPKDLFGRAVAMAADGTTALVGAPGDEDPNGLRAGAAYVFDRVGGQWRQQANLAPADGDSGDRFGGSVAMAADGTTAIVGAEHDENPNGEVGGSAYVFERSNGSWTQQAKLAPADGDSKALFGDSVAMTTDGTTALVGAGREDNIVGEPAGAVYVF